MSTRAELSEKSQYWIGKHRYYELKHFCLQYPIWKKAYDALDGLSRRPADLTLFSKGGDISRPVEKCAESRIYFSNRMNMVKQAANETDAILAPYILRAVTEGLSYDTLKTKYGIPCCKDVYYDLYHKFFWRLNRIRD